MKQIIIDPRLKYNYASWYLLGVKRLLKGWKIIYDVRPFKGLKYKNTAESETGALGLMQLMPDTARWVAQQVGHGNYTDRQLKEPETNIELGTWYLGHLLKEFNGDEVQALAAYNAGRGHVESWLNENKWNGMVDTIPFPETRSYVKAVLQYQQKYEALYGNDY